jgi:anthranilate phosphoribosyltransferase
VGTAGPALGFYDARGGDGAATLDAGIAKARDAIDSGAAKDTLASWVAASS